MPTSVTTERIQSVIDEALVSFGADAAAVRPEATFEELDIDSLDIAELAQIVEEQFGVALGSADVGRIRTVADAVDLVAERL